MKKRGSPSIRAELLRSAFIVLSLLAVCLIPFALGQRSRADQSRQLQEGMMLSSRATLTFEERVAYQRAIEDVYWRHRIWPKENSNAKPSLDVMLSQAKLQKKVRKYLRNSQVLEDYWQRPITAEQLQAEMDRMATHTKQSEVLQELFEALRNDPFVIAECLARPALADRLLTNWYAYDQRIHGDLKRRAETELQTRSTVEQMKQLGGKYSEIEFVKSDRSDSETCWDQKRGVRLTSHDWDKTVHKLASGFGARCHAAAFQSSDISTQSINAVTEAYKDLPVGKVSRLQEDQERYYATAVIEKSTDRLKLATVSWLKEPLESWTTKRQSQVSVAMPVPVGNYTLPKISEGGCVEDTWTATAGGPDARIGHTAVWTGTEMIVWGGLEDTSGGKYNPSTDTWAATSTTNAPEFRPGHTAVWTGSEMIIWGGGFPGSVFSPPHYFTTGGRYNPVTDSWIATSTNNAPEGRTSHTAIWTGSEMIVWGGGRANDLLVTYLNTGGKYNPSTDTWAATSTTNVAEARYGHTAVWTGSEMLVWGGTTSSGNVNTGGIYDPGVNLWAAINSANAPTARAGHTAVWTGTEMIVWGNSGDTSGGRYNRGTNSWTATSMVNAPEARAGHTAVWTGTKMIVWGGENQNSDLLNTGGRYDPFSNRWTDTDTASAPTARIFHTAVWTGTEMIVWGGTADTFGPADTAGGRYNPNMDSWVPTASAADPRYLHTAVWTGSEMIVWGGIWYPNTINTGGRYNLSTDSWTPTSISNAPDARYNHTAVWTGSEMIVWGGWLFLNTGGKYNPISDNWTVTTTANAPVGRYAYTAVWTGTEMIVWGGDDENFDPLNTGGRYDPSTNSWAATNTVNAPEARDYHTAVWSGNEMIVWGGAPYLEPPLNTGGRYDPNTDIWTATNTVNAPEARSRHTAVWTGTEMIVWGGTDDTSGGRYNPNMDNWTATSTVNAPSARYEHTAVWTGNEMIIWGSGSNTGGRYNPSTDGWTATSLTNAPNSRTFHTAIWTGNEMIVWGGVNLPTNFRTFSSGGRYCGQGGPTPTPNPTPTPYIARSTPTPRPHATPVPRP
jgi:N-acetylneuraminic acid mutarotase